MKLRGWHISAIGTIVAFLLSILGVVIFLTAYGSTGLGALLGAIFGLMFIVIFFIVGVVSLLPTLLLKSESRKAQKVGAAIGILMFIVSLLFKPALPVTIFTLIGSILTLWKD